MSGLLSRFGLKVQIGFIGALGTVALLLLGGFNQYEAAVQAGFLAEAKSAEVMKERLAGLRVALLDARRAEKDFLLRREERYARRNAEVVAQADAILAETLADPRSRHVAERLGRVKAELSAYRGAFAEIASTQTRIGLDENGGLLGSLRGSVHEAEAALRGLDRPALTIAMLMMRRHEKDFLARVDAKYVEDFKKRNAEFAAALPAAALPEETSRLLLDRMAAYQRDFLVLAETTIGLRAHLGTLSAVYARMEPVLEEIVDVQEKAYAEAIADWNAARDRAERLAWTAMAAISAAMALLSALVARGAARPVLALAEVMRRLAGGEVEVEVPGRERRDEIGGMAKAVEVFRANAVEMRRLDAERAEAEAKAREERRAALLGVAEGFEAEVRGIVEAVAAAAAQVESAAQTMAATSQQTQRQASAVASASEEASASVGMVAGATRELSSSIQEIGRRVAESSDATGGAVREAEEANRMVAGLSESVRTIGDVVRLISEIASQTNLLALNATIEAARAGEMGKGFAVVAAEVKGLATQTARATEEIQAKVSEVQGSAGSAVQAIQAIGSTIGRIDEIAAVVASAVEEQGAATKEIAENVEQAAGGTQEVSRNIAGVLVAAGDAGSASRQFLEAAQGLARDARRMREEVDAFLGRIRAA